MVEIRKTEIDRQTSLGSHRKSSFSWYTGMTRYLNKIYLDSLKNGVAESVNSALWLKGNKFASEVLRHLLCVY